MDHVDQSEDREDQELVVFGKEKDNGSREDDQDGKEDETPVRKRALLVDDAGDHGLGDRGNDIGKRQKHTDFRVGETISKKEDGGTRMDRTERGKVSRVDKCIADRPEDRSAFGRGRFVVHVEALSVFLR